MALRSQFPQYVEAVTGPFGRGLARTPLTPNWLTTFGLALTAVATYLVASGQLVLGGWVLLVGGLMDAFDGALARATGRSTPFGSFYDSVSDRISDGLILGGLAWLVRDEPRLFALAIVALVGAEVTSYVRAKAEGIDLDCTVGIMERAERAILLMVGLILHRWLLEPVLWLLAVGGTVTVVQRIHHVWCQIDRDIPDDLLALALHDRAWSRAFKRAARRFYGQRNFDDALDREAAGRYDVAPDEIAEERSLADEPAAERTLGDGAPTAHRPATPPATPPATRPVTPPATASSTDGSGPDGASPGGDGAPVDPEPIYDTSARGRRGGRPGPPP